MKGSWKTTSTGILMIAGGLVGLVFAFKNGQLTEGAIMGAITAVVGGVGLLFAKDSGVTGGTIINPVNDASVVDKASKVDKGLQ